MKTNGDYKDVALTDVALKVDMEQDDSGHLPPATSYILPVEAAERFSYVGVHSILKGFLRTSLGYSKTTTNEAYHILQDFELISLSLMVL